MALDQNIEREIGETFGRYSTLQSTLALRVRGEAICEPSQLGVLSNVVTRNGLPYTLLGKSQDIIYNAIDAYRQYIENDIKTKKREFTEKVNSNLEGIIDSLNENGLFRLVLSVPFKKNGEEHNRIANIHDKYIKLASIFNQLKEHKEDPEAKGRIFEEYIESLPNDASKLFASYLIRADPLGLIGAISEDAGNSLGEFGKSLSNEVEEQGKKKYVLDKTKLKNYINTTFGKLSGEEKQLASEIVWMSYLQRKKPEEARKPKAKK